MVCDHEALQNQTTLELCRRSGLCDDVVSWELRTSRSFVSSWPPNERVDRNSTHIQTSSFSLWIRRHRKRHYRRHSGRVFLLINCIAWHVIYIHSQFVQAFENAWNTACSSTLETKIVVPSKRTYLVHPIFLGGPCLSNITLKVSTFIYFDVSLHRTWLDLTVCFVRGVRYLEPLSHQKIPRPGSDSAEENGFTSTRWTISLSRVEGRSTVWDRNGGLDPAKSSPPMYQILLLLFDSYFQLRFAKIKKRLLLYCSHADTLQQ